MLYARNYSSQKSNHAFIPVSVMLREMPEHCGGVTTLAF